MNQETLWDRATRCYDCGQYISLRDKELWWHITDRYGNTIGYATKGA